MCGQRCERDRLIDSEGNGISFRTTVKKLQENKDINILSPIHVEFMVITSQWLDK